MQFVNETFVYFNNTTEYLKELLNAVYVEHPNAYLHVLITMLFTMIILTNLHIKSTHKRLNEMDKRYTILLLSIQKYCTSLNRSVNEVLEKSDKNTQIILDNNTKIVSLILLVHQRVKDAYTVLFKHLDVKNLKCVPKGDEEQCENADRDTLIRKAINEIIITDFSANQ